MKSDLTDPRTSALQAATYLRDEADFNRSWTDGRNGPHPSHGHGHEYVARRIELAEERERWAAAIEALAGGEAVGLRPPGKSEGTG